MRDGLPNFRSLPEVYDRAAKKQAMAYSSSSFSSPSSSASFVSDAETLREKKKSKLRKVMDIMNHLAPPKRPETGMWIK